MFNVTAYPPVNIVALALRAIVRHAGPPLAHYWPAPRTA
jgi:hypothetical protein